MNKHLLLILLGFGSFYSVAQEKILVLKCTDIDNDVKLTWDVVINDVNKSISFYDRTHSKTIAGQELPSVQRVKTYLRTTTYYESIKYDYKSKLLTRTTTEVPATKDHPYLTGPKSYSTVSKCKKAK